MNPGEGDPDPLDIALGGAVRIRRLALGMSQEALADRCGVSFQQVQKYERGTNRISFSRLVRIAMALQCRVADLLNVLDEADGGLDADPDGLRRMAIPGAVELLALYELLPPDSRVPLVDLVRSLSGGGARR